MNPRANEPSIGEATMDENDSITLRLRATGPGGITGDGLLVVRPGDPNYESIMSHVDGLKPGESKPVPPWNKDKD